MKALVYEGPQKMELREIPAPEPEAGELLIKVKAVGVCGSDVEGYLGKTGRRTPPMVMGHEFAGIVAQTDSNSGFRQGDKVVVQPKLYCGQCNYCRSGLTHMCPQADFLGVLDTNGAMTEYVSVPEQFVFKVNDNIELSHASLVEPLAVAGRAVNKIDEKKLKHADYIMIIGAGTIGLLVLQILKLKGVKNVIVSDLFDYRLKKASDLGADFTVNAQNDDLIKSIQQITDNNMVDYSLEAVGVSASASQSVMVLKNCGTAVWIGNAQKMIEINMQEIVTSEINIKGTYIYTDSDFKQALQLIEQRQVNLDPLISAEEPLANGVSVFEKLADNKDGKLLKVILTNSQD